MKAQLDQIERFRRLRGAEVGDRKAISLYVDLLTEELTDELRKAVRAQDRTLCRDGVADCFVVAAQLHALLGAAYYPPLTRGTSTTLFAGMQLLAEIQFEDATDDKLDDDITGYTESFLSWCARWAKESSINLAADVDAVMKSNFSKFHTTEVSALHHIAKLDTQGAPAEFREAEGLYGVYAMGCNKYPAGKLLKPDHYQGPVFAEEVSA